MSLLTKVWSAILLFSFVAVCNFTPAAADTAVPKDRFVMTETNGTVSAEPMIVGGTQARQGEFPCYTQGLGCGGSLIWKDIVLSAGHCNGGVWDNALIGAYQYQTVKYGAERIKVDRNIVHPGFSLHNMHYDYRILRLNYLPRLTHQICTLNTHGNVPSAGAKVTIIGLGSIGQNTEKHPEFLNKAELKMVDFASCNKVFQGTLFRETMICATGGTTTDTCFGDSGGPLFDAEGNVAGITSFGYGCANGYP